MISSCAINLSREPLLTMTLLNDTEASNSDMTVRGRVVDRNQISRLEIALDGTTNYVDFTFALEAYQYDANGNRTNAGYQTGTNNQLQADGQFTYQYGQEGNRTKRTEVATGKVTEYVWDYHNRVRQRFV